MLALEMVLMIAGAFFTISAFLAVVAVLIYKFMEHDDDQANW